jgi:hypothetical protein
MRKKATNLFYLALAFTCLGLAEPAAAAGAVEGVVGMNPAGGTPILEFKWNGQKCIENVWTAGFPNPTSSDPVNTKYNTPQSCIDTGVKFCEAEGYVFI